MDNIFNPASGHTERIQWALQIHHLTPIPPLYLLIGIEGSNRPSDSDTEMAKMGGGFGSVGIADVSDTRGRLLKSRNGKN